MPDAETLRQVETRDFIDYGFEPEFIGRLPVRVVCEQLSAGDLFEILQRSEGSIIRQYERAFHAYGIEASFTVEAMRALAERASLERTGARGLLTVTERLLRDCKYELPGSGVDRLAVTEQFVAQPAQGLKELLALGADRREQHMAEAAQRFAAQFRKLHGVGLIFDEQALHQLVERAKSEDVPVRDLCARLFRDYQFGLKLIQKNTGQSEFSLPAPAVKNPDKYISELVVQSYQAH